MPELVLHGYQQHWAREMILIQNMNLSGNR